MKKILIIASSTNTLQLKNNKTIETGYYLSELAIPAQYFIDAGFSIVIATPDGQKPIVDQKSANLIYFNNDEKKFKAALGFVVNHPSMQKPKKLSEVAKNTKDYVAVFIPGGHAPMNDLMKDNFLGKILHEFHQEKKITAFICHGTVAALAALPRAAEFRQAMIDNDRTLARELSKKWLYAGYSMTSFSNEEEKIVEKEMQGEVPFYIADALTLAGGYLEHGPIFAPYVSIDRELITAQNPATDLELAKAVVREINERKIVKALAHSQYANHPGEFMADI